MDGFKLGQALRGGQRVYGTHIASMSPLWPKFVRSVGLDFVFIDTEHVPVDRETLAHACLAYQALGIAPIVRIPEPDAYQACMALDAGAAGIVAPYVETRAQAVELRGAVKLRPLKGRRLAEALSGMALEPELERYLAKRNAGSVLILNIESVPALEALDDILSVPGVDAVLVGPHDLSCSLGLPERYDHPRFDLAVHEIIRRARERGVGAGVHVFYPDSSAQEIAWARAGANLMLHGSDGLLFATQLRHGLDRLRDGLGERVAPPAEGDEMPIA